MLVLRAQVIEGMRIGHYVVSKTGKRMFTIAGVTRVSAQSGPSARVRLSLAPVSRAKVPTTAIVHPWPQIPPRPPKSDSARPVMRPAPRETIASREKAQFTRVVGLLADDRAGHPVASVRTRTIASADGDVLRQPTAEPHEWVDPDDVNPNRRVARKINGFRRPTVVHTLQKQYGQLTKKQVKAADQFTLDHQLAIIGRSSVRDLNGSVGGGFGPGGGPTEAAVLALRRYQATQKALGRSQFRILDIVVLQDRNISDYATIHGVHRNVAMGYLLAALDKLVEHYDIGKKEHQPNEQSNPTPTKGPTT